MTKVSKRRATPTPRKARKGKDKPADTEDNEPTATWRALLTDVYLTIDRRTLGFTRICLGWLLLCDLFRRTPDWEAMFANRGVLPTYVALLRPQSWGHFSILHAFSTPAELWTLWVVILLTYVGLLVGYRTKLMQVLALLWVTSLNGRVLLIENGGYIVHNLLLLWTCFLPLGDRFSIDALRKSLGHRKEGRVRDLNDRRDIEPATVRKPFVSLTFLVVLLQLSVIYYFNVVHKTGPNWHDGTAVHFVLYVDRMVTPLIGAVRDVLPWPVLWGMTNLVLATEALIPLLLLSPLFTTTMRRVAVLAVNFLHIGFGSTFVLGPFAWSLCVFSTLLIRTEDWELIKQTARRRHRARHVLVDPRSPGAFFVARVLARMDRLKLLYFSSQRGIRGGLAVAPIPASGTTPVPLTAGLSQAVAALPLAPALSAFMAWRPIRAVVDAAWTAASRRELGAFVGLSPAQRDPPDVAQPAPLRLKARWWRSLGRELLVLTMWVACINQAAVELWSIRNRWQVPQPEIARLLTNKLRFLQGWFMFSPNPVKEDGTLVVDAVTIDGRHIDPFTGEPPNFDLTNARSFAYNQIWSDYFNRIQMPANRGYRDAANKYMKRLPERTGNPSDKLVGAAIYWVRDNNPPWGSRESFAYKRQLLWAFGDAAEQIERERREQMEANGDAPRGRLTEPPPRGTPEHDKLFEPSPAPSGTSANRPPPSSDDTPMSPSLAGSDPP